MASTAPVAEDFSRTDLMTPFSLSLAAERALESAKLKLDQMDTRLLKARSSISLARRRDTHSNVLGQGSGEGERGEGAAAHFVRRGPGGRLLLHRGEGPGSSASDGNLTSSSSSVPGVRRVRSLDDGADGADTDLELKTREMKKLRDDLRQLRSRMSQTRAISEALNLTPPRNFPRSSEMTGTPSSADRALGRSLGGLSVEDLAVIEQFPKPPSSALGSPLRPSAPSPSTSAVATARWAPTESETAPVRAYTHSGPQTETTTLSDLMTEAGAEDYDLPMLTSETPFSPRPYSSQSIITPFPAATPSSSRIKRPSCPIASASALSFVTASESFSIPRDLETPQSSKRFSESSSMEYSDADTSVGLQTPTITHSPGVDQSSRREKATSTSRLTDESDGGDYFRPSFLRSGSSQSTGTLPFGSLAGLSQVTGEEQRQLLDRVQSAIARMSVSIESAGTQEERRRNRKLALALAILEDSEED